MPVYYLSFVKEEEGGWVGGCFIRATSIRGALTISHLEGCNPGGEVLISEVDDKGKIPNHYFRKLLNRRDLKNLDRDLGGSGKIVKHEA